MSKYKLEYAKMSKENWEIILENPNFNKEFDKIQSLNPNFYILNEIKTHTLEIYTLKPNLNGD